LPMCSVISTREVDVIAYVLGDFTPGERQIITQVIPGVSEAILCLLTEGLTIAMNKYNRSYLSEELNKKLQGQG